MPPTPRRPRDDIEVVDADEASVAAGPDRADGSAELDQRDTLRVLFNDPAVRNYTIAAFAALAMIFLILFGQGSDIGGLLIAVIGAAGIVLRWVAAPVFVLLALTYFMVFPFGIPGEAFESRFEIADGRFRPTDVMLVGAVLVYVACQYRLFGFVHQAVAYEGAARRRDEPPTRRPPALVTPSELGIMLGVCAALVLAGQLVWLAVNSVAVLPAADFPLRWVGADAMIPLATGSASRGSLTPGMTRFVLLVGVLFFGVLLARLVFGYWRLRALRPEEGAMILLDGDWLETKRERSRVEKWRVWGRKRAEARAKAAAEADAQSGRTRGER